MVFCLMIREGLSIYDEILVVIPPLEIFREKFLLSFKNQMSFFESFHDLPTLFDSRDLNLSSENHLYYLNEATMEMDPNIFSI